MKKEMVGDVPGSMLGMLADLAHKLQHGTILPEELGKFLQRQNPFVRVSDLLADWQNFYYENFSFNPDFTNLKVPEHRPGFDWLIAVPKNLTIQEFYEKFMQVKRGEPCIDSWFRSNDRSPADGPYAVWVRNREEADEELKEMSADLLKKQGISCITFLEYLLLWQFQFQKNGKLLDCNSSTLCAGSLSLQGGVPSYGLVFERRLRWESYSENGKHVRARQVIAL